MADINPTVQIKNNDAKIRNVMDFSASGDLSNGQFLDMISSTNLDSDNIAAKDTYNVTAKNSVKYSYDASSASAQQADTTTQVSDVKQKIIDKADIKEKIKTKLKEISEKNDVAVKDTKALKALQKVANFLLKANQDGKIALPKAMVDKLQAFVDKGDDLKAADITQFMSDFSDTFKQVIVAMPAQASAATAGNTDATADELKWPSDITDALKDLGLQGTTADPSKGLTLMDVLRTVKSLVNESEKAAIKTLDDKSKESALPQDQASVLVVTSAANASATSLASSDPKAAVDQTAQAVAATPVAADSDAVKKAIKDLEKNMQQAAAQGKALPAPAKDDKAAQADAIVNASIPKTPAIKVQDPAKSQPINELASSLMSSPATKTADNKIEAPSLSKISLEAQAPDRNNDKSFDNRRDNSARTTAPDLAQAKANLAASVAAPVASEVKITASEANSDAIASPAISAVNLNAVTDGLKAASRVTQAAAAATSLPSAATQQVVAQIQQKIDKSTQISVQLTPAELGRVEVRLNIQKDGSVHTVVTVDKPETLALLQKDSAHLERSLQDAGLNADAKNMSFNLRDGNQAQQFNQGRKRFSRSDIGTTAVTEVAVNVAPEGQIITDNRVNYHA